MRTLLFAALTGALVACDRGAEATSFGGVTQSVVLSTSVETDSTVGHSATTEGSGEDSASSTSGTANAPETSTGEQTKWDMGVPDFGVAEGGCRGKIDFLFVISTQSSMKGLQEKVVASFPGFVHAIEEQMPGFDIHILSANTDEGWLLEDCSACTDGCDPQAQPPYCGADYTICDKKVGAGVTFPAGEGASNRLCSLDSGRRYITSGQEDLEEAFDCIARVGFDGSGITAEAMTAAIQPAITDPLDEDACNSGFIREDALLVVTIIQDMYDQDSVGTVDEWIAALDAAKGGDSDAYAVLVLTTDIDLGFGHLCHPDMASGTKNRLRSLAEGVEHGFIESLCIPDIATFFGEKVADIVQLCDEFVVPG